MQKKWMKFVILSVCCLFPVLFFGCRTKDKAAKHVILISMDTTRADHLSCYGFDKKTTPYIDKFAKDSVLFEHCISPIPLTLPAHISMLTGTNPIYHGVHNNDQYTLDEENITISELLKEQGFETGAIVSTFVLDRQFGMNQGFDTYDDTFQNPIEGMVELERRGDEASQVACEWLEENKDKDFFLFLHYYDPHDAYQPPEPYASRFSDNLYAGEIAYTDFCIMQVLDKLKELKIYDNALIIIVGDHGEGRGDHNEDSHGYYIYHSCIHVPMIVHFPKGRYRNKRINKTVGLIDLPPTICRWTGLNPLSEYVGQDLTAYLEQETIEDRSVYSESLIPTKYSCSSLLSLTSDRWKYVQSSAPEMYDLKKDPAELNNLIESETKRARIYQEELKLLLKEQVRMTSSHSEQALDEESRKKLESLGYVAGESVQEDFEFDISKDPPVEWLQIYQQSGVCKTYLKYGLYQEAENTARKMIADKPFYVLNYYYLADAQQNLGKYTEAISTAREFLERAEEKIQGLSKDKTMESVEQFIPDIYMILGKSYFEMKEYETALQQYEIGLKAADGEKLGKLFNNIANVYMVQGKLDLALEKYLHAIEIFPSMPEAHFNIGLICSKKNQYSKALQSFSKAYELNPEFEEAKRQIDKTKRVIKMRSQINQDIDQQTKQLQKNPNDPDLLLNLGQLSLLLGEENDAITYWQKALKLDPENPDLLNNLAFVYVDKKNTQVYDPEEALEYAQKANDLTRHQNPNMLDTLALVHAHRGNFQKAQAIAQQALVMAENNTDLIQSIQRNIEKYNNNMLP